MDLESGAVIAADVRPGDAGDTENLSTRVLEAVELVEEIHGQDPIKGRSRVRDITGDKGFHSPGELAIIQKETGAQTIIRDANAARQSRHQAARAVQSKTGKVLLKSKRHAYRARFRPCPSTAAA